MELLVDTNTLIDLALVDALDFLTGHTFYVAPELDDLLDDPDLLSRLDRDGDRTAEYTLVVDRLKAFRPACNQPPVGDFREAMKWSYRVQQMRLDAGEHQLCCHLPRLPDSVLMTSDMRAIDRLMEASAKHESTAKHFHSRCLGFEEIVFHVLQWKSYSEMQSGFLDAQWRRWQLEVAFRAKGKATTDQEFCRQFKKLGLQAAQKYHPFVRCSWPQSSQTPSLEPLS